MENHSRVRHSAGLEDPQHDKDLCASKEAVAFADSIDPTDLQRCVFTDNLVSLSKSGRDLGKFSVTVEFACRAQRPCMLVHAQSEGAIENSHCGTTVTAYITCDLEVLEEDYYEYIKVRQEVTQNRCHIVQRLYHRGIQLTADAFICSKGKVPENMTFISIDQSLHIISATFLGVEQQEIGEECVEVFGIRKTLHFSEDNPQTWHCYFLSDGFHLVRREVLTNSVLLAMISQLFVGNFISYGIVGEFEKMSLSWEEDMQMRSKFLDRKEELKADHASYLRRHPEIRALISDFLQFLLLRKPDDVFQFSREYFLPFASQPGKS
uniref:Ciliogenesis-associated TTC17-interacting protein n=1 Tax=Neogobius melanostomus TaxID=47308 RepID=A0A8C6UIT9_9GOBI